MKQLLTILSLLVCIYATAQCNFPTTYLGSKVQEIVAFKGKVYMKVKDIGFVAIPDSAGQFQVIGYEQSHTGGFAKLACGQSIQVVSTMPNYIVQSNPATATHPGVYLKKSGTLLLTGTALTAVGVGIGTLIYVKTDYPELGYAFYAVGAGGGAVMMLVGFGMLIKSGNAFIRLDNKAQSKLQFDYHGTSASLRLRF